MARNITYEPCTLVYTLLNKDVISFSDFNLIIRSLHNFMVEDIQSNEAQSNMHVKLGYQASLINAQNKLGNLKNVVAVSKLSNHIKECEFSRLEQLRRKFGINHGGDEPSGYQPKRRSYNPGTKRVFKQRSAPYTPKQLSATVSSPWEYSPVPDAQPFTSAIQEDENSEQSSDDNTKN